MGTVEPTWTRGTLGEGGRRYRTRAEVEAAFRERGIRGLAEAYPAYVGSHWTRRLIWGTANLFVPISALLAWGVEVDRALEAVGFLDAAESALDGLNLRYQVVLPEGVKEALRTPPVLAYGNHPSSLADLFLIPLGLDRPDLKLVSASSLSLLLPSLGPHLFPVQPTFERKTLLQQGLADFVFQRFLCHAEWPPDPTTARESNRLALKNAAAHVAQGGALLIVPGSRSAKGGWFPGIGVVAGELARSGRAKEVRLAPYCIRHVSAARTYSGVSRRLVARVRQALLYRRPAEISFSQPVPLSELVTDPEEAPAKIADRLRGHYKTVFPS